MITIPLTQGQVTIIDDVDADLAAFKWSSQWMKKSKRCYAQRSQRDGFRYRTVTLHRKILSRMLGRELTRKEQVDHINGDSLDNRRSNLRLATASENLQNKKRHTNNKSGYKGVSWRGSHNKWRVEIQVRGQRVHLGYFDNIEDAAKAYQEAAIKYFGEFARFE